MRVPNQDMCPLWHHIQLSSKGKVENSRASTDLWESCRPRPWRRGRGPGGAPRGRLACCCRRTALALLVCNPLHTSPEPVAESAQTQGLRGRHDSPPLSLSSLVPFSSPVRRFLCLIRRRESGNADNWVWLPPPVLFGFLSLVQDCYTEVNHVLARSICAHILHN